MSKVEAGGLERTGKNGGGLAIGVGLAAFLGKLGDKWSALGDIEQERVLEGMLQFMGNPVLSPTVKKLIGSKTGAASAATYSFIDLGTPPGGKIWDVRRLAIWGTATDAFTAVPSAIANIAIFPSVPADGASAPALEHVVHRARTGVDAVAFGGVGDLPPDLALDRACLHARG